MIVTRIGPMSLARISGVIYAIIGFIVGCFIAVFSVVGQGPAEGLEGIGVMALGAAAVFMLPLFYGFFGFVSSLIVAGVYNTLAGIIGGVEIEVGGEPPPIPKAAWPPPQDP